MKRRAAREIAVQSLYQMEMNEVAAETAIQSVLEDGHEQEEPIEANAKAYSFIHKLVDGTWNNKTEIDQCLEEYLKGWKIERLSRVDKQVLRLAAFEMLFDLDSPPKVVINEAIDLSKHFGTEDSGKFVNGVLGKMIKELDEIRRRRI